MKVLCFLLSSNFSQKLSPTLKPNLFILFSIFMLFVLIITKGM